MKIKVRKSDYRTVMARRVRERRKPLRTSLFMRYLLRKVSSIDLRRTGFEWTGNGLEQTKGESSVLVLMNHSSFIDLEIALSVLYPRPVSIVCEADGFVGKETLMRHIGCIPTHKFNTDLPLVKDIVYCVRNLHSSVLMYPEASYSFDGTSPTPLPESLGKLVKMLKIPVLMIKTEGAFHRDPLYNRLQKRNVKVSADVERILTAEDCRVLTVDEINSRIRKYFQFDHFEWQKQKGVRIDESFRAEGLESVLYKCPVCLREGEMTTKKDTLMCSSCLSQWRLGEDGSLTGPVFSHIPSWFRWEREETEKEIDAGEYTLDVPVRILLQVDYSAVYDIGKGRLQQNENGFHLVSDDSQVDYTTSVLDNYSLSSDIYWYEIGDMISIGDDRRIFYLFPEKGYSVVTRARFATEAFYRRALARIRE